jgi:hypothetical protein
MRNLMFKCPRSGVDLDSGIRLDDRTHDVVEDLPVFIPCRACRTMHTMRVRDGQYRGKEEPVAPPLQPVLREAMASVLKLH